MITPITTQMVTPKNSLVSNTIRLFKLVRLASLSSLISFYSMSTLAENRIELETTIIRGNTELPKVLYLIPWQEADQGKKSKRKLQLHSINEDIFTIGTPTLEEITKNNQDINLEKLTQSQ